MKRTYRQLTQLEREDLALLRAEGRSLRQIARQMGRSPGTISREIERNTPPMRARYSAIKAQGRAENRRRESYRKPRLKSVEVQAHVEKGIKKGLSPERIAGRLRFTQGENVISHEAIYQWIYGHARHLIPCLVRAYPQRRRRGYSRKHFHSHHIPERVSIADRPAEVACRAEAGHWEADTMVHRQGRAAVAAVVERKTRYTKLTRLRAKNAREMRVALTRKLSRFPAHLLKSITYDNGSENTQHQAVNAVLGTRSYFCEPFHSWEKGTVENAIGVARRFLPKKTDFETVSDDTIQWVENWLNHRPMKCLGFKTPAEAFRESVALRG